MLTIYSDDHRLHHGRGELNDGQLQPCVEFPARADNLLTAVRDAKLGEIIAPDYLVVSLGVDTFVDDPISQFRLKTGDYLEVGSRIGGLNLPSLFVLEGGYAVSEIGQNVVNVLRCVSRR